MKYNFESIIERNGQDALAVEDQQNRESLVKDTSVFH